MSQFRVAKLMAQRGLCSRREAERLIAAGQVMVDGQPVREQGVKAEEDAEIVILDAGCSLLETKLTVLVYKPAGVVSTLPQAGQIAAWQLLRADNVAAAIDPATLRRVLAEAPALGVAGRLDRASRGLLLLTQDGILARRLVGGGDITKTYLVRTAEPVTEGQLGKLRGPLRLDDRRLRPMQVERAGHHMLRFVLVEGRKHQIRRVCRKVGLQVTDLLRTAIGPLTLDRLAEGKWRPATAAELRQLREPLNPRTLPQ
jgi:23S rRNA pseudouridine2604 synthase